MGQICTCDGGDAEEADSGRVAGGGEDEIFSFVILSQVDVFLS